MNATASSPTPTRLLQTWLLLGLQSFGGGVATLALIRQTVVERKGWMSEAEFAREWTLVQAVPGINLFALTILIGKRLAGWRGIVACMMGLLLPSAAITIVLTASYAHIQRQPQMQAALRGIVPATVGLGGLTAFQIARTSLVASRRAGSVPLLVSICALAASALAALRWHGSILPILFASGSAGAITQFLWERQYGSNKATEVADEKATEIADEVANEENRP